MEIKKLSRRTVIAGTLIIWVIKFGIRPFHLLDGPWEFFLGVAPNLIGSFLIPFGACWFFQDKKFFIARFFYIHSITDLNLVCIIGFILLVMNEYLQLIPVFGRTFDYFDIFFSAAGLTASYFTFRRLLARYNTELG